MVMSSGRYEVKYLGTPAWRDGLGTIYTIGKKPNPDQLTFEWG